MTHGTVGHIAFLLVLGISRKTQHSDMLKCVDG